jgi:hypothetical protein
MEPMGDGGGLVDHRLASTTDTPGYEVEFDEPTFADAVEQVADVISDQSALFSNPSLKADVSFSIGTIKGSGSAGAAGIGTGKPGRKRRWEVQFHDQRSIRAYAQQLDYFKIELAVLRPGGYVLYFSQLTQPRPFMRQDLARNENRFYLTWLKPELQEADRQLIEKTGTTLEPKQIILKILPVELEQQLVQLERDAAGKRLNLLRATYFGVRQNNQVYECYVIRQTFDGD